MFVCSITADSPFLRKNPNFSGALQRVAFVVLFETFGFLHLHTNGADVHFIRHDHFHSAVGQIEKLAFSSALLSSVRAGTVQGFCALGAKGLMSANLPASGRTSGSGTGGTNGLSESVSMGVGVGCGSGFGVAVGVGGLGGGNCVATTSLDGAASVETGALSLSAEFAAGELGVGNCAEANPCPDCISNETIEMPTNVRRPTSCRRIVSPTLSNE